MAVKYEEFKKEFAAIEKAINDGNDEHKKTMQWTGQASGILKAAAKEIGARVQELKDKGATGTTIKDFENDPEVKQHLKYIEDFLARTDKQLKHSETIRNTSIAKAVKNFWDLKKELTEEINKRKKKQAGILKIDSKSLPDMEKMLVEFTKYKDSKEFLAMEGMVIETVDDYRRDVENTIKDELAKTKEEKVSAARLEFAEQALNIRVLKGNMGRAKTIHDLVEAECKKVAEAKQANNPGGAKTALVKAMTSFKDLHEMAKLYKLASEDSWIKTKIADSKDKGTILQGMNLISSLHKAAGETVKKAAA
jgi:metal-responsive CopG/Arc/MetJ family transcriptional regulator